MHDVCSSRGDVVSGSQLAALSHLTLHSGPQSDCIKVRDVSCLRACTSLRTVCLFGSGAWGACLVQVLLVMCACLSVEIRVSPRGIDSSE